jgi:hypothetical protein
MAEEAAAIPLDAPPALPDSRKSFFELQFFETNKFRSENASRLREILFNTING